MTENTKTQSQIKTAKKLKPKMFWRQTKETGVSPPAHKQQSFLTILGKIAKLRTADIATRTAATADLYKILLIPPSEKIKAESAQNQDKIANQIT